jgi:hypothetical protein
MHEETINMAKLVFGMNQSLDGYIDLWTAPKEPPPIGSACGAEGRLRKFLIHSPPVF